MKNWLSVFVAATILSGCTHIDNYSRANQIKAPDNLQGIWRTEGPQRGLVSPAARATLFIDKNGNTLDCREWQRVIAKPGKLILVNDSIENLNQALRHRPLVLKGQVLHYDKLSLRRGRSMSQACQNAANSMTGLQHQ